MVSGSRTEQGYALHCKQELERGVGNSGNSGSLYKTTHTHIHTDGHTAPVFDLSSSDGAKVREQGQCYTARTLCLFTVSIFVSFAAQTGMCVCEMMRCVSDYKGYERYHGGMLVNSNHITLRQCSGLCQREVGRNRKTWTALLKREREKETEALLWKRKYIHLIYFFFWSDYLQ